MWLTIVHKWNLLLYAQYSVLFLMRQVQLKVSCLKVYFRRNNLVFSIEERWQPQKFIGYNKNEKSDRFETFYTHFDSKKFVEN